MIRAGFMGITSMNEKADTADELAWRWHDNVIYGLRFDLGEPESGDWRSELVLEIDFIIEWLCGSNGRCQFRVAPALLTFHSVADFAIAIDPGDSGGRNAIVEWTINRVTRDRLEHPFDYWRWAIYLNAPPGGTITFCSTGFTEVLTGEPVVLAQQRLPPSARRTTLPQGSTE